uniref:CST complex subunit STN1 n=1 Tax=Heterorhabditis bacteriophora TaxID=37862 RepID=A0A1I7WXU0_HETBA
MNHLDRLPLPIEIANLCKEVQRDGRITIGDNQFSTVTTVGRVIDCYEVRSRATFSYTISDPSVPEMSIPVIAYKGLTSPDQPQTFDYGSLIFLTGKLQYIENTLSIHAYALRELVCPEEYDSLKMESFLAKKYHKELFFYSNYFVIKTSTPRTPSCRLHTPYLKSSIIPSSSTSTSMYSLVNSRQHLLFPIAVKKHSFSKNEGTEPPLKRPKSPDSPDSFDLPIELIGNNARISKYEGAHIVEEEEKQLKKDIYCDVEKSCNMDDSFDESVVIEERKKH